MLLESIKLENFRQFRNESIDFAQGQDGKNVTIIIGENGTGKTTFAQAFFWCMYGETEFSDKNMLNKMVANDLTPGQEASVRVELKLKHDDFAQSDYEAIYSRIVELNPSLKPFVDYVRSVIPPQRKEIRKLKYQFAEGNMFARTRMIEMHLRLALRISLQRAETYDMDIEDAISYGCIGLINAVDRYDPDTSGPFASYAALWIVQNISREQPTQRPLIYYPVHKREGYFSTYPLLKANGCIGCSELQDCSRAVNMVMDKLQCDEKEASSVILESIPVESIDTLIEFGLNNANDDYYDDVYLADGCSTCKTEIFRSFLTQVATNTDEIFFELSNKLLRQALDEQLSKLTLKEAEVIKLRYGYYGKERTLEEVGKQFGVTRERIRQIETKAIRKLRHPSRAKHLRDFL